MKALTSNDGTKGTFLATEPKAEARAVHSKSRRAMFTLSNERQSDCRHHWRQPRCCKDHWSVMR